VGGGSDANFTSELAATLDGLGASATARTQLTSTLSSPLPERAALLALLLLEPSLLAKYVVEEHHQPEVEGRHGRDLLVSA
jgi:hypothetical protein